MKINLLGLFGILQVACVPVLSGCSPPEQPTGTTIRVERVVSGQTLEIVDQTANIPVLQQVRLLGITAPDLKQQPWGEEAKRYLQELCQGKEVLLEGNLEEKDPYGRILAYVWLDGVLLNEQLVQEGYVLPEPTGVYEQPALNPQYSQRFQYAQERARILGLGIWNPQNPMRQTPNEFRRQNQ